MMNYATFKDKICSDLKEQFGKEMVCKKIQKVNFEYEGVSFKDERSSIVLNLTALYSFYLTEAEDYMEALDIAEKIFEKNYLCNEIEETAITSDVFSHPERIFMKVINAEKNVHILDKIPHRKILDLAIIYCVNLKDTGKEKMSYIITNEHWEGKTEEDLHKIAVKNLEKPDVFELQDFLILSGYLSEEEKNTRDEKMYVVTDKNKLDGAIYGFQIPFLTAFGREKNLDSFYILPSSIHEVIILPNTNMALEDLKRLVKRNNKTIIEEYEFLSNNVYFYQNGELTVV